MVVTIVTFNSQLTFELQPYLCTNLYMGILKPESLVTAKGGIKVELSHALNDVCDIRFAKPCVLCVVVSS